MLMLDISAIPTTKCCNNLLQNIIFYCPPLGGGGGGGGGKESCVSGSHKVYHVDRISTCQERMLEPR